VLQRVGRLADGWIVMGNVQLPDDTTAEALAVVRDAARRAGREPAALGVEGRLPLLGQLRPDAIKTEMDAWRRLGATHISLHGLPPAGPSTSTSTSSTPPIASS
jgi:hypothetical protein